MGDSHDFGLLRRRFSVCAGNSHSAVKWDEPHVTRVPCARFAGIHLQAVGCLACNRPSKAASGRERALSAFGSSKYTSKDDFRLHPNVFRQREIVRRTINFLSGLARKRQAYSND
jgi:hypothetical protein